MVTITPLAKGWLGICMLLFSIYVSAQAPSNPSVTLVVEPSGTTTFDPIQDPGGHPFASDTAIVRLVLVVSDTSDITTIHVKLGTSAGGSQLLTHDFAFDVSSSLPAGTSYRREGNAVYLGLGNRSGFNAAYATVSLENASGTSGDITASFQ